MFNEMRFLIFFQLVYSILSQVGRDLTRKINSHINIYLIELMPSNLKVLNDKFKAVLEDENFILDDPVASPELKQRGLYERPLDYWYNLNTGRARGLVSGERAGRWDATDSDGLIAIPYSFHASYSQETKARVRKYMDEVNKDQNTKSLFFLQNITILNI